MKDFLKVGVSGVRGVVGESFTPQIAASFARAFASFVGHGSVLVGRDTRPSGYAIECAVVAGLQSAGATPIVGGVIPTPSACLMVPELGARGGIVITASHNPSQWNALKFIGPEGRFLTKHRADELYDIYHQGDFPLVAESDIHETAHLQNPMEVHVDRIFGYVDVDVIQKRKFRVALDCCNGVGAVYTRKFLELLGCEVVSCFDTPTGAFEREPEPIPQNLAALCSLTTRTGADIGFAQDPDGDRLAIVDEAGQPIGEDLTLAFVVRQVLDRHARGPVAINLSTSMSVQKVAEERGSRVTRTKIGEINVVEGMLEIGAVAGGEGNGGAIVPAIHPCRDSFGAMALTLELLAMEGKKVSELRDEIPRYHVIKDKVRVQPGAGTFILRKLRKKYEHMKMNLLDGVYVEVKDGWLHVRASNTEPVLRVSAEAPTFEEATALVNDAKADIQGWMKEGL